ncbi:unnamed protein product [Symbiodinium natans]|uniref:Uncharacterized protein n=1 Tax=Symbiodinium natans TaxID=878477 RepID=A0A812HBP7_9DINO|nr:unnamed protein product [Symbiodinium natans]
MGQMPLSVARGELDLEQAGGAQAGERAVAVSGVTRDARVVRGVPSSNERDVGKWVRGCQNKGGWEVGDSDSRRAAGSVVSGSQKKHGNGVPTPPPPAKSVCKLGDS